MNPSPRRFDGNMSHAHMIEFRDQPIECVEFKFRNGGNGKPTRFTARASSFNRTDQNGDTLLPGTFTETLRNRARPVRMFKDHKPAFPIGKWLALEENDEGLDVEGELTPGNSIAEDVGASMRHGAVDGLSIGYIVPPGGLVARNEATGGRVLRALDLVEISVTTMPADDGAQVLSVKSMLDELASISDAETLLRDAAGFSRLEAKAFISKLRGFGGGAAPDNATLRDADVSESLSELIAMENVARFGLASIRMKENHHE